MQQWIIKHPAFVILSFVLFTLLIITPIMAQDGGTCPAIVERALTEVGNNCAGLERNTACYGFNRVVSTFNNPQPADLFDAPSDRAPLIEFDTIQTTPLDDSIDQWGIAILNVQANIPNTLPGQGVIFMLVGDVTLTNDVAPDDALEYGDNIIVTVAVNSPIFSSPTTSSNTLGEAAAGMLFPADGLSSAGDWVRILNEGVPGWIPLAALDPSTNTSTLPMLSANRQTPMQAFYFTTGIGDAACAQAESALAIQSPQNLQVELTVNGVDISVGSTIFFQTLPNNQISMTVVEGEVITVNGVVVTAGQTVIATIDDEGRIVSWGEPRPATDDELLTGQFLFGSMQTFSGQGGVIFEQGGDGDGDPLEGPLIHIVQPGENLYRIALQYDTSMQGIVDVNGLANPNAIFVGQRLIIPNPGSGFVGIPGLTPPDTTGGDEPIVDTTGCGGFQLTSPLGNLPFENVTFYWDPAPGAASYQMRIYADTGNIIINATTTGTSYPVDATANGLGTGNLSWDVQALDATGNVICTSGRAGLSRGPVPPPSPTPTLPPFRATLECIGGNYVITWYNALPTDTVNINFTDTMFGVYNGTGTGSTGSRSFFGLGYPTAGGTITTTSGLTHPVAAGVVCP